MAIRHGAAAFPTPVVLTLHTPSPEQDASFLQALFPRAVLEQGEKSSLILSINGDDADRESENGSNDNDSGGGAVVVVMVTLVLLLAPRALKASCLVESTSYLFQQATVAAGSQVMEGSICGISIREIQLPAGGSILLVPPLVVASLQGRKELALRLAYSELQEEASQDGEKKEAEPEMSSEGTAAELPPGIHIPSLQLSVIAQQGQWRSNIPLNTQAPIPVETDLFKGQMLLLVRPPDPAKEDPYWNERVFAHKSRRLIFQMQGKFKYQPSGVIYAGGQVTKPMKLGLVTRGLSTVLLRLIESFNSKMHYSFGTTGATGSSEDDDDAEMAHIVMPAHTFFEHIVITPPGETPPPLTELLEESPESSAARKSKAANKVKDVAKAQPWNTTDTFSMSFYTMYIDLPSWQLRQLPSANVSLHSFWGDSLLRICMYEKQADSPKKHLQKYNKYIVAFQLKHLTEEEQEEERFIGMANSDHGEDESSRSRGDTETVKTERRDSIIDLNHDRPVSFVRESDFAGFEDLESYYFDAEDGEELNRDVLQGNGEEEDRGQSERDLLRSIDNACPAWIEVCAGRSGYSKAFAVIQNNRLTLQSARDCEDLVQDSKYASRIVRESFSSRLSSTERTRRKLGLVLSAEKQEIDIAPGRIESFLARESKYDTSFLKRPGPSNAGRERMPIRASCFVARAISDRHWIEEWATLTEGRISFYHPDKRSSHYRIPLSSVVDAAKLPPSECPPILGRHILALSTPGRTVYLLFSNEGKLNEWLKTLRTLLRWLPSNQMDVNSVSSFDTNASYSKTMEMENPADEFMHKSSMWSCKNRRILNCARFSLYSGDTANQSDPLKLVETALREALKVSDESSGQSLLQRRAFLVSTALLKDADVQGLSEDKKTVFFLNLYHVMILHAYLVLGPTGSSLKWINYFNNAAYQVADDIFSLTELEHCIICARMSHPSNFLSRFVIPKSRYRFALTRADYRFNFALNCGSKSNPRTILIYNSDQLQDQLDEASRDYLSACSVVPQRTGREVLVHLPRICQWFLDDFGGSNEGLLHRIEAYLPDKERQELRPCWLPRERRFDMKCVTIRFLPYQFECQPLRLRS